ncbi:MAG: TolC family protein [Candidatus Eisenbacteria bacterium]
MRAAPGFLARPALVLAALTSAVALAALLVALALPAHAASRAPAVSPSPTDTLRLSLEDAVSLALTRGVTVGLASSEVQRARGQVREAEAVALPQINTTGTYQRRFASIFSGVPADSGLGSLFANSPFGAENQFTLELTGTQLLFSRSVGAAVSGARWYQHGVEHQLQDVESQVVYQTRGAYLLAAYIGELVRIAEEGVVQARANEHDVKLLFDQGARAEYDYLQAQVEARNAEPPVMQARNAFADALYGLKKLLNVPAEQPMTLTTPLAFPGDQAPVVETDSLGAATRAALLAAEAAVEVRKRAVTYESGARWPELSASGTMLQEAFPSNGWPTRDQFFRDVTASAKLTLPIFQGFRTEGAVARAKAELRSAELNRDQVKLQVDIDVEQARQDLNRALTVLAARRGTVELAQRTWQLARTRYDNGMATQLEVSDARLKMLTSQADAADALRAYRTSLARLEFALGHPPATRLVSLDDITEHISREVLKR